ncbi:MAG: GIY-YIG nuclease family protein [Candidatus Paceibacterota bacterium]
MSHYVYILECSDKTLYVGCTNDLSRRLYEHNNSRKGAHYTKMRRPVRMVYHKSFLTLREARRMEIEIKSWKRKEKLIFISKGLI